MHQFLISILSFCLGLSSGFIGALSSGGGLISIPGLIFLGLSPSAAIATTRLNVVSGGLASLYKFNKEGIIQWKRAIPFLPIAFLGGIVGSKLLLHIDEHSLEKSVGILLLLLAPVLAFSKNFGLANVDKSKTHQRIGFLVVFIVLVYNAMFGGGGGTFLIYTLVYFYGMNVIQANANGIFMGLFTGITALIIFLVAGAVNFSLGIPMMIGASLGGYLGAHTAIKKGNKLVRWVFLVIVIVSSIKLIFF